jgi:hypothetical protein
MGRHVYDKDVADPPRGAKSSFTLRHCRKQLIRVQTPLHQQFSSARTDELDGFLGCRLTMWDIDKLYVAKIYG